MVMLQQMIILFIIMMTGLLACKLNILTSETSKNISSLVINIANPCFIVSSVLSGTDSIQGKELLILFVVAVVMYVVLIIVGLIIPILLCVPKHSYGVYRAMTVFSNIGFMGFPIISGIYGNSALLYATVFLLPYNLLIYTYGVYVMKQGTQQSGAMKSSVLWKALINPGVIAGMITIIIYLCNFQAPLIIKSSVSYIGNLTAPLSMMVIGASFQEMNYRQLFSDVRLLGFSLIKLVVLPLIGMLVIRLLISNTVIQGICLIMLATPVGSMVPMLANEYDGDTKLGSAGVAVTTVLSVVTLSLISFIL